MPPTTPQSKIHLRPGQKTSSTRLFLNSNCSAISLTESHIAPPQPEPVRLQEYGVGLFSAAATRSAWKKVLKKQFVTVDDVLATTATYIRGGERIQISIPDEVLPKKLLNFPLQVLFEDDHLAAIHKPGGIEVSGNRFKTIAHALPQSLRPSPLADATQPQPVHRLDYPTTGIVLAGKTRSSIRALNAMFEDQQMEKIYFAVTIGEMPAKGGITAELDEKEAQTEYEVLDAVPSSRFGTLNLVRLRPRSGRRHQLRRHLTGIGHPILGDQTYGREDLFLKGKGLYLHAFSLTFMHPFTGESISIRDPLPERFDKLFGPFPEKSEHVKTWPT